VKSRENGWLERVIEGLSEEGWLKIGKEGVEVECLVIRGRIVAFN